MNQLSCRRRERNSKQFWFGVTSQSEVLSITASIVGTGNRVDMTLRRTKYVIDLLRCKLNEFDVGLRAVYYYLMGHTAIGDPYRVYYVPPQNIQYKLTLNENTGKLSIIDEGWEDMVTPLSSSDEYSMLIQHFQYDVPWENTVTYKKRIDKLSNGGSIGYLDVPSEKQSIEHYHNYLDYLDKLYNNVKKDGYKSQEELRQEEDFTNRVPTSLNEVQVAINYDGQILLYSGMHRIAIAHALDLELIPVRTRIRHLEWQKMRNRLKKSNGFHEIKTNSRFLVGHPELQDVV